MDGYLPLKPGSRTFVIAGQPTASAAAVIFPGMTGEATYIFDNTGNAARAWIGYGSSSTAAQAAAAIPANGASGVNVLPLAGQTVQAFTLNAGMYFSAVMEQGSGSIVGTAGYGN